MKVSKPSIKMSAAPKSLRPAKLPKSSTMYENDRQASKVGGRRTKY